MDAAWDVRACLDWIERSEMFITPLDDRRKWYRYHHLFQELLQQRATAEMRSDQIAELHRLASAWFEAHGMVDEALHHALESGDLDLVARQINAGLRDQVNREDRMTLERWLRLLPEEAIQKHPGLLMLRVWVLQFSWRHNLQAQVLQLLEEQLDSEAGSSLPVEDVNILRGQILLIRSQHAYFNNQTTEAIKLCRQALALLPTTWTFARGGAMLYLGMSMQASGQALAAERLLLDEYESYSDKTDTYALLLLQSLCFIYTNSGQLERTRQIAQVLAQTATRSRLALKKNWGDYFLGLVCYLRNELPAAAQHFTHILENRFTAHLSAYRDAVSVLASIYQIQEDSSTAWQMVESISQFDLEQKGSEDERTRSLRARILLMQGDNLEDAYRWADSLTGDPPDRPLLWLEEPQLMRVRVLMARASEADLRLATQILNALDEIAERTFNTRYKIEILALRALALDVQGEPSMANAVLLQAVDLAQMGGFIRVFADLGKSMEKMLLRLVKQDHPAESIQRILAAFREKNNKSPGSQNRMPTPRYPLIGNSTLIEPLTPRELDVLVLLRERLSNKEIAHKLSISYATVKRHTINIYAKLDVNRRWDAVARAIELGILPPD
jgi:LuxR family maltose regulon positive regulatory protein